MPRGPTHLRIESSARAANAASAAVAAANAQAAPGTTTSGLHLR